MKRVALITGAARGIGRAIALELATDHDIAKAVCFLVSDNAAFVTGECITVSGGYGL